MRLGYRRKSPALAECDRLACVVFAADAGIQKSTKTTASAFRVRNAKRKNIRRGIKNVWRNNRRKEDEMNKHTCEDCIWFSPFATCGWYGAADDVPRQDKADECDKFEMPIEQERQERAE